MSIIRVMLAAYAMRLFLVFLFASSCIMSAHADEMPAAARAEIMALLNVLEKSGCEFQRNGSWHTSAEAKAHLQRKLENFATTGEIKSADRFIELAATSSSVSGQAYWVRCANATPVTSKSWLGEQLVVLRLAPKK